MLSLAACSDNKNIDDDGQHGGSTPVFPQKVERSISIGEQAVFTLSPAPNMAWTISVDSRSYFKVEINGEEMVGTSRSGEAGAEVEVKVTGRVEEFDESHTMVMKMTMGGQTEDIAEILLLPAESTIEVYTAELAENGKTFKVTTQTDADNNKVTSYVYSQTALANGAEIGLYEHYTNHLQVVSNRNWKASCPKWLAMSQQGGMSGVKVEIDIESKDAVRPFDDSEGKIEFSIDGQTLLGEYKVAVKGCADEFDAAINNAANVVLTAAAGRIEPRAANTDTAAAAGSGSVTAAYGSRVLFAFPAGSEEWIKFAAGKGFEDSAWSDEEKSAGLHTREFTIEYTANESLVSPRAAYMFCIPRGSVGRVDESKLLDANGAVNEEYEKYMVAYYYQQYAVASRPDNLLFVQSMVGKDDDSTAGDDLFAMVREYNPDNLPADEWWSAELKEMPTVFKLTLRAMAYCELAVLNVSNADEFDFVYAPEDRDNQWIESFGRNESGSLYRFIFKSEVIRDAGGNVTDIKWATPKVPQAYVICKNNGTVTGALVVELDAEAFDIPLQNVTVGRGVDAGFTELSEGNQGYSSRYGDVPQYKVNGYDVNSNQADVNGRINSASLTLKFNVDTYSVDFDKFEFEPVEDGQMTALYLRWPVYDGWDNEKNRGIYKDSVTGQIVEDRGPYLFTDEPQKTGMQITYFLNGNGPDQFRIICKDASGAIVCTVYVYYQNF